MRTINLERLADMQPRERKAQLDEVVFAARAPRNGQASVLQTRVTEFETRYGMTSTEMQTRFRTGRIEESADVSRWLMLLRTPTR